MKRCASCLATLIVTLAAATAASSAIRRDPDYGPLPANPAFAAAPTDARREDLGAILSGSGIDPDSNKARIILGWVQKIQRDPVIATGISGGARRIGRIFLDPAARNELMSSGIARLAPADRLEYVKLIAKFLDELVPVNCYGLADMSAVMNRVSLREMSESDVDQYFSLIYKILVSDASNAPVSFPTPQQYAAAVRQLTRTLIAELQGDQTDIERFALYSSNPSLATPLDVCWTTRVTLHAIIAMPDPERDLVLLRAMGPQGGRDPTSARRLGTPGAAGPLPASSKPGTLNAP
ncbi:hypothetical protein [Paraburkholderia sp. BL10I2N1]|uniref:hypothetical protein n=1 Tax=Paraburkholderia sp. BL10I2N1 TaxID=1938796 RepID=UPI00105F2512|nr:hypothetical protein [Paraburkholderia sp. BL10I2N1]TDN57810.1 hypothetical protein B0G77_8650 [Paraburkholderia sp. BL10I2N1]